MWIGSLWPEQNVDLIDGLREIDLYIFIYKPVYFDKAGKTCGIEQVVLLVDSLRLGVIQVSTQQPRILEILNTSHFMLTIKAVSLLSLFSFFIFL